MDARGLLVVSRCLSAVAMLGVAAVTLGSAPVIAAGSWQATDTVATAPQNAGASPKSLAQAPMGLRLAVRSALEVPNGPLQKAKLTASDGAAGDNFGNSVALAGSTAVVGSQYKNSDTGAAYVFVRSGTTWTQQAELNASDGIGGDFFGSSVAISGSTVIVGAGGVGSNSGAAYVFVRSGTVWFLQAKLVAPDGAAEDGFGYSVAISGSTIVVGASGKLSLPGAVYVFVRSGAVWSLQAELIASDAVPNDFFGWSVAISANTLVVGSPYFPNSRAGAAYVFMRSGTSWSQQAKLTASDAAGGDNFGSAVAISGSTVVVGAPLKNTKTGAAYVFVGSGATWTQHAELTAADGVAGDFFGFSVALSASTAVVGCPYTNKAYAFVGSGTTWTQEAKLTPSDGAVADFFGGSVAISGSTAVVGAPDQPYPSATGAAYVFVLPSQQATVTTSDTAAFDYFGFSVAISGSIAVLGAPYKNSNTGAAYVFVRSGTTWSEQAKFTAADAAANDYFGYSVAISGSSAVVGAPYKNSNTGAAYVFVRSGTTWSQQAKFTAADGAANDYFGYSVALSGSTAVAGAYGKSSTTGAAYVFVRSGTTWTQQAKLTTAGAASDSFGFSVAISGSTAMVAATGTSSYTGAGYVFVRSGATWTQQAKLTASDGAARDNFGYSVAFSGTTAVFGAIGTSSFTGAAYVFVGSGATWTQQAKLIASDGAAHDYFGWSVAVSGSTAVVGAFAKNSNTGAAYVFARSRATWTQQAALTASDGTVNDHFGYSVAISGSTAVVGAPDKNTYAGAAYVYVLP